MKDIYIAGPYSSGKSWAAQQLSLALGIPFFETDAVYIPLIRKYGTPVDFPEWSSNESRQEAANGLRDMLKNTNGMIINGVHLNYRDIRQLISGITGRPYLLFNIVPSYERWLRLFDFRLLQAPEVTSRHHRTWSFYVKCLGRFEAPDDFYYTVENGRDLICQMGSYQRPDLSARKFAGLPVDQIRGRVLDLGCAEGLMGKFLLERGKVKEVVGVDTSWWFLEQARQNGNKVVLGDLNTFDLTDLGMFDYTLCLSILHRVMDKEHLIQQIAACTWHEAIFELPLNRRTGLICERYDSVPGHTTAETQAWCPSQDILELWFKKYFSGFEMVGLSPLHYGDESWRVVYRCRTRI